METIDTSGRGTCAAPARVSINTDDPSLLGTNLRREYEIARLAFSWSDAIVRKLAHASIEASFANPATKARLKSETWLHGRWLKLKKGRQTAPCEGTVRMRGAVGSIGFGLLSHRRPEFLDVSRRELRARKAARSAETICVTAGEILRAFTPTECANHFLNSGYAQSIML